MAQNGKLRLELLDVYGKRLQEKVDISLRNLHLDHAPRFRNKDASKTILINDLHAGGQQNVYQVSVDPPSYRPVGRFVTIKTGGTTELSMPFPVDIKKIVGVTFPTFPNLVKDLRGLLTNSSSVFGFENQTGAALYGALDDIRRAGLLNIARKSLATRFSNNESVLAYVTDLKELRGDRFFASVDRKLREETKNSLNTGLFHEAPGMLHSLPPQFTDFVPDGSYKTDDKYGNLQLTFFKRGDEYVADIDIDDAGGLGHIFQVVRNHVTGSPTHPYNIHEILVQHQRLDPGYRFKLT